MELKKFQDNDLSIFKNWLNKPHIKKWYYPTDEWIKEITNRNEKFSFVSHYMVFEDNIPIGFCQYYDYALGGETWHKDYIIDKTYSMDYLIGDDNYLHKGYGAFIIRALETEMIQNEDVKSIIVQPEKNNLISRKTLIKANYLYDEKKDLFYKTITNNEHLKK